MRSKSLLVLYISFFLFLPFLSPSLPIQTYSSIVNTSMVVSENSGNDFYVYHGMTNNLISYISPSNQSPRFQTAYFGTLRYNWQDSVGSPTVYGIGYVDPPGDPIKPQWLHDHGITLNVNILGRIYNPLDIYYNASYKQSVITEGLQNLETLSYIDIVDEITLGDEAPATLYNWKTLPVSIDNIIYSKYNASMHEETGIWMKTEYSNETESWIFQNWLSQVTMTAMNSIYDGIKQVYPAKKIFWNTLAWPGFEPTLLKGDLIGGGYYTTNFRQFYSQIRFARLVQPTLPVYSVIMGSFLPFDHSPETAQEQYFWTAYFAGSTRLNWFNPSNNLIWNSVGSPDTLYEYEFHNSLNKLANTLPILDPKPLTLVINTMRGADVYSAVGFREYDATTQLQAQLANFSLNHYKIVVVKDQYVLTDALTDKLTNYVHTGGTLILKGWLQSVGNSVNASAQSRGSFLPLEIGSSVQTKQFYDKQLLNINNPVIQSIIPNVVVSGRTSLNFTSSPDWIPIPTGMPEESQGYYPIVLYHNSSDPQSGYILYFGFEEGSDTNLYIPFLRDFVQNFLSLHDVVTPANNPNILISTSVDSDNRTIIGVIPDSISNTINFGVNITERGYPQDNVWFYDGFSSTIWDGEVYDPTNLAAHGMAYLQTSLVQYKPQRWIFTPEYPDAYPDLQIYLKYPAVNPIAGENIPISVSAFEGLQYVNLHDFSIELKLPQGLHFSDSSFPHTQTLDQVPGVTRESFDWLVQGDTGTYNLQFVISSANLTQDLTYNFLLTIYDGRIEINLPHVMYFTPTDPLTFAGTMYYVGKNPGFIDLNDIIQDYIWGNPGGWIKNITASSGHFYSYQVTSNAQGYRAGESGVYTAFAYNKEHTTIAENYMVIKIVPSLFQFTPVSLQNGIIRTKLSVRGIQNIDNVKVQLVAGSSVIPHSDRLVGTISPGSSVSLSWNIAHIQGVSTLSLVVTGNNAPTVSENFQVGQTLLDYLFYILSIILISFVSSFAVLFLFNNYAKFRHDH